MSQCFRHSCALASLFFWRGFDPFWCAVERPGHGAHGRSLHLRGLTERPSCCPPGPGEGVGGTNGGSGPSCQPRFQLPLGAGRRRRRHPGAAPLSAVPRGGTRWRQSPRAEPSGLPPPGRLFLSGVTKTGRSCGAGVGKGGINCCVASFRLGVDGSLGQGREGMRHSLK